jgi:DNA-binding beta-propeller fold protein YncE
VTLGPDRVALIREHYPVTYQGARLGVDWYILDDQLLTIATYPFEAHGMPAGGFCSADVHADPTGDGWILLCSDPFLAQDGALVFLSRDGSIVAQTPLSREMGYALGMTVTLDQTVNVLTSRPVVARIDARTRRLIDARPVTETRSLLDWLLPPAAAAKGPVGPGVVFSLDARYAYLIGGPDSWWGTVAKIDLATAKVVASASGLPGAGGLALSEDGERLYALVIEGRTRTLALLDPRSLRLASQTAPLANDPYGIVVVRGQLPLGP